MRIFLRAMAGVCLFGGAWAAHAAVIIHAADFPLRQITQDGNLYAPGEVGAYVNVSTAGVYTIELTAMGTPVAGAYPVVGLSINSFVKQQQTIGAYPAIYTYSGALAAGVQQVGWFLHNDASAGGEDRNVFIDSMRITSPAGAADVALSTKAAWIAAAQAREDQAVADSAAAIETYRKGPAVVRVVNAQGQPVPGAAVQVQQLTHGFRFGASTAGLNSFGTSALNGAYAAKFKALFNYATVPMYWGLVEPTQGQYSFAGVDAQAAWAASNGMRIKAHAILYALGAALPAWTGGIPPMQDQLDHVTKMMQRYAPGVGSWEIVNEPLNAPGMDSAMANNWARALSPGSELVVNDYGHFFNGYPELFALLQTAVSSGIPIDAIGVQAHAPLDMAFPLDRVRDVLAHYATLGKAIHITEFTPSSGGYAVTGNPWRATWNEATQADYAEKFYRVCFGSPAVDAISWWDVCDTGAWCPQGGLLRADMSSKPAYDKLNALINTEWRTNLSGAADAAGAYAFRGFYGMQRVTVSLNGASQSADVTLAKGSANEYTLTLNVAVAPAPAVTVDRLITKNTKPVLTGAVSNATSVSVKVNGKTYAAAVNAGAWSAAVTTALAAGTYDVQTTATAGGGATATDTTAGDLTIDLSVPVITITGSSSISIKRGSVYTDAGATASDNVDGNITARVVKTGTVNTATTGTYYIRYNVSDTAGNAAAQKTRTVKVVR